MLSDDSFNLYEGAEAHTTQLASSEEDHHDAAGLVGHDTFKSRISSPRLNPHGAHPSGERCWKSRLNVGDEGAVGGEIQYWYIEGYDCWLEFAGGD